MAEPTRPQNPTYSPKKNADGYAVTEQIVMGGIEVLVGLWKEAMKEAVSEFKHPLLGTKEFLQKAAMFSFAKDAVAAFDPGGLGKKLASTKAAPTLFLVGIAATAYDAAYEKHMQNLNKLLASRYKSMLDEYKRKINDTSRLFAITPYGLQVKYQTLRALEKLRFTERSDVQKFAEFFMEKSGFIETEPTVLKSRAEAGYGRLAKTVYALWLGSYRGPGGSIYNNKILIMPRSHAHRWNPWGDFYHTEVTAKKRQDEIMMEAWRWRAIHKDGYFIDKTYIETRKNATNPMRITSDDLKGQIAFPYATAFNQAVAYFKKSGRSPSITSASLAAFKATLPATERTKIKI